MPPECFAATKPAGAAPRPASRLMSAPLNWTRWVQDNHDFCAGDSSGMSKSAKCHKRTFAKVRRGALGCRLRTLASSLVNSLFVARLDMNKVRH